MAILKIQLHCPKITPYIHRLVGKSMWPRNGCDLVNQREMLICWPHIKINATTANENVWFVQMNFEYVSTVFLTYTFKMVCSPIRWRRTRTDAQLLGLTASFFLFCRGVSVARPYLRRSRFVYTIFECSFLVAPIPAMAAATNSNGNTHTDTQLFRTKSQWTHSKKHIQTTRGNKKTTTSHRHLQAAVFFVGRQHSW